MDEAETRKTDSKKSKKLKKKKKFRPEQPLSVNPDDKAMEAAHRKSIDISGDNSNKRKSDGSKDKTSKRKKHTHEQLLLNNGTNRKNVPKKSKSSDDIVKRTHGEKKKSKRKKHSHEQSLLNNSASNEGRLYEQTVENVPKKSNNYDDTEERTHGERKSKINRLRPVEEEKVVADVLNEVNQNKGRPWTVSIALPGSILDNAQSLQLRTYLAGQIARAAVVFNVDEIIVFDESGYAAVESTEGTFQGMGRKGNANVQLARILQYLECPQYLRKNFFPRHPDLQFAGVLNPLDCPHHMRAETPSPYREGVVVKKQIGAGKGSYVDVGKSREVQLDKQLQPGLKVTVKMNQDNKTSEYKHCKVVSPLEPRTEAGLYWGYSVRLASSLGAVFTNSPFKDGYDLTIGTSERGDKVDDAELPEFRHLLVVFGGLQGLETSLEADEKLNISEPSLPFDQYLNTCPDQGSRTIRTEEAILVTMSALRPKILQAVS